MTADAKLSPKAAASLLPTEGPLIPEELQLATRNGGMPLEALRYDITPVGLHYQLIHFDIPDVDPATWRLRVDGLVERPLDLSYDEIRALPAEKLTVTLECAGNGRARLFPRPLSMPWLNEAIGTARWRGVPLHRVLDRAGVSRKGSRCRLHGRGPRNRERLRAGLRAQHPAGRRVATGSPAGL